MLITFTGMVAASLALMIVNAALIYFVVRAIIESADKSTAMTLKTLIAVLNKEDGYIKIGAVDRAIARETAEANQKGQKDKVEPKEANQPFRHF